MEKTTYHLKDESLKQAINKIRGFGFLESGWRYGEGEKISDSIINFSINLLSTLYLQLFGLNRSNVFVINALPSVDGGIVISLGKNDDFIELAINSDRSIDLTHEKGIGADYTVLSEVTGIHPENHNEILTHLYIICNLSAPFTLETTMRTENDLQAKSSETIEVVFPYSMRSVPSVVPELCVTTY